MTRGRAALAAALSVSALAPSLAAAAPQVVQGQVVRITVRVTDELGSPLSGVRVHLLDETEGAHLGSDDTDPSGLATLPWDTSGARPGSHELVVRVEEGDYVESAIASLTVEVLKPARLALSVSGPAAVRPGERIQLRVTVSNLGQAAVRDAVVRVGREARSLGDLSAKESSKAAFSLTAPREPGVYELSVEVSGREWGTGRMISETSTFSFRVRTEGVGLEIRAPRSVTVGRLFTFSLSVSNVGEDPVNLSIRVHLSGAAPAQIEDSVFLGPGETEALGYRAAATRVGEVRILAVAEGGGLRAVDEETILAIREQHPPPSATSPPNLTPTVPSSEEPSEGPVPSWGNSTPHPSVGLGVNLSLGDDAARASPAARAGPASAAGSGIVMAVLAVIRGVWRVEER